MSSHPDPADLTLSAQMQALDPDSARHRLLCAARDFKASWVQLAQRLTQAREARCYADWGFVSFADYCRRELRLKQETAHKLTRSYSYLRDHEPQVLGGEGGQAPPALDVVDLLSQAKARTQLSPEAFETIREQALSPEGGVSRAYVLKKLREADPDGFAAATRAKVTPTAGPNDMRRALVLAERLHSVLSAQPSAAALGGATQHAIAIVAALRAHMAEGEAAKHNWRADKDDEGPEQLRNGHDDKGAAATA